VRCSSARLFECRLVGESSLRGKKRNLGRGETVKLYNFEFKLEIGVPDYPSNSEKNFLGLNQIYPQ
jgi:hypothetical protein